MLKNKVKSRKFIQNRNSKKINDRIQSSCIFKLITEIPKTKDTVTVFNTFKLNLKYAEILLAFCESKLSEELDFLEFSKTDSVGELIFSLTKLITDNKYTIVFDNEEFHDTPIVDFNFTNIKYDWHWYIMEAKLLDDIKSQELKIGYAHIMKRFGKQTEVSFINHNYSTFHDSMNEYETDYIESCFDEGEIDVDFETIEEYQDHLLKPYREMKAEYNLLIEQPIELFFNYKPKNKPEQKLKKLLEQGLKIDFSIIHRFPDDECPHTDDGSLVSYTQSFMLIYDWKSNLEEIMMERWNMEANEYGVTNPVNYIRYEKGEIIDGPTPTEEKELNNLCKFLSNLSDFF